MDLGVILESPKGRQSSSRVGACTCAFLPSYSSSVTLPVSWIKGSVVSLESFPWGFPTGLFHVPPLCESILGVKVEAVQRKQEPPSPQSGVHCPLGRVSPGHSRWRVASGVAGLRLHMRKAPNGISCQSRGWPLRSLAGALGSRQLTALGGGALGLL